MRCTITTRAAGRTALLAVEGELDLASAPQLAAAFAVARITHEELVVDLSKVTFVDSTGLRELLGQADVTARAQRRLRLVAPGPRAFRVFELTGVASRFDWVERPEAPPGAGPLPERIARHKAALNALDSGAVVVPEVARVVADALGDACVISELTDGHLVPLAVAHRQQEAEALMRQTLVQRHRLSESEVLGRAASGEPVFGGDVDPRTALPAGELYRLQQGVGALAALPVGDLRGGVRGILGASRDRGREAYDAQDRKFLLAVAGRLAQLPPFGEQRRESSA